jgi:hypothetical protein
MTVEPRAWFAIVDADWAPLRKAFERWLDPGNFDPAGRQKVRLADLMNRTAS